MKKVVFALSLILVFSFIFVACGNSSITYKWMDADGNEIKSVTLKQGEEPEKVDLPADTDEWHYTGWEETKDGNNVVYKAIRESNPKVTWFDLDGKEIKSMYIKDGESIPFVELPDDPADMKIDGWYKIEDGKNIKLIPNAVPNASLFSSRVFKIFVYDENEIKIGTTTGFILDEDGTFIADYGSLKDGYYAKGVFEGESKECFIYLTTNVDKEKGIVVGKVFEFSQLKASERFKDLKNGSAENMDVLYNVYYNDNEKLVSELSYVTSKKDGSYETKINVPSTGFGGIVLDSKFNFVGLLSSNNTNGDKTNVLSANTVNKAYKDSKANCNERFSVAMHPEYELTASLLRALRLDKNYQKNTDKDGVVSYSYRQLVSGPNGMNMSHTVRAYANGILTVDSSPLSGSAFKESSNITIDLTDNSISMSISYEKKGEQKFTVTFDNCSINEDGLLILGEMKVTDEGTVPFSSDDETYIKNELDVCYSVAQGVIKKAETNEESHDIGSAEFFVFVGGTEVDYDVFHCEYIKIRNNVYIARFFNSYFNTYMKWSEEDTGSITGIASLSESFDETTECTITYQKNVNEYGSGQEFILYVDLTELNTKWPELMYAQWTVLDRNGNEIVVDFYSIACWY